MKHVLNVTRLLITFLGVVFFHTSFSFDIGSDGAVTRFANQVVLNEGDRVAGFASLAGGFKLFRQGTDATFDSFFPVAGNVNLNFGTLHLTRDLIFNDVVNIQRLGNIDGNFHSIEFSSSVTCIPNPPDEQVTCQLALINSYKLPAANSQDNVLTLDWNVNGQFLVAGLLDNGPTSNPLLVYEWDGISALTLKASDAFSGSTQINLVRWHPTKLRIAAASKLISGTATELRIYDFDGTSLTLTSSIDFSVDAHAVAWHPSGNYLAVARDHNVGTIPEVSIFAVSASGIISQAPSDTINYSPDRVVQMKSFDWKVDGNYLAVGLDSSGGDQQLRVYAFDESSGLFTNKATPATFTFGNTVNCLQWSLSESEFIAVGLGGGGGTNNKIRIMQHNPGPNTITQFATISLPGSSDPLSIDWNPCADCLVTGWNSASSSVRMYKFVKATASLTETQVFGTGASSNEVRWAPSGQFIAGSGKKQESGTIEIFTTEECFNPFFCVFFSDVSLFLSCNVCIKDCCITFTGDSAIVGRGKCLTLDNCTLSVDSTSTLLFKDITVKGIKGTNIQCLDESATIEYSNARWVLDDDYTFGAGKFDVLKDFTVIGEDKKFIYTSDQVSSVETNGRFILEHNLTFSYDPPVANKELINLIDETAQLMMNGATLHATTTGLQLTKGQLVVDRESFLSSEATVAAEAISFGDGVDAANNLTIRWRPAGKLTLLQGHVLYNNV